MERPEGIKQTRILSKILGPGSFHPLLQYLLFCFVMYIIAAKFSINYEANSFYMDGKPFRYISGSVHYFRIPKELWRDRLRKTRAAGLNAISTYVEWSQHEAKPGVFEFGGDLNLPEFIKIAEEENLYVILRPGPYICAERDMGGLPFWLLNKQPDVYLRTKDPKYTKYVERWLNALMTKVSPFLYGKGGPIILVQVENEYGSYTACDQEHLIWLRDLFRKHVKDDAVLFTTDGAGRNYLKCGKIEGVYATVDFGAFTDVKKAFAAQRKFEPKGPLVNSEYYTGWLTHWGERMARTDTLNVTKTLEKILDLGANVNLYMFHGGTNFGFTAGANYHENYLSDITSYDYDSPITEAGDLTEKYFAIKNIVEKYLPNNDNITVSTAKKGNYGEVELIAVANMLSEKVKDLLGETKRNRHPLSFEALNQNVGYLLYETYIQFDEPETYLQIRNVKDLGNVYLNGVFQGTLSREFDIDIIYLRNVSAGDKLSIAVENLGRINYGSRLNDTKGILSNVFLGQKSLTSWNMTSFELKNPDAIKYCLFANRPEEDCLTGGGYTFYMGSFQIPAEKNSSQAYPLDSFLDVSNLTKGVVFINDHNLGRYWSVRGPQFTLYVPGVYLKTAPEENIILIMDEYISSEIIRVRFSENPIFFYGN